MAAAFSDRPWIHFIGDNAAESGFIKWSSDSLNRDVIGDRVASKSNPIDGVSRKVWDCDPTIPAKHQWSSVKRIKLPVSILKLMQQELFGETIAANLGGQVQLIVSLR